MTRDRDTDRYPLTRRNTVWRKKQRAHYDRATVHAVLDAAVVCHIAYAIDGQPYCTPIFFWRDGERLYWHGSPASRRAPRDGLSVCLTVTHLDSLVFAARDGAIGEVWVRGARVVENGVHPARVAAERRVAAALARILAA